MRKNKFKPRSPLNQSIPRVPGASVMIKMIQVMVNRLLIPLFLALAAITFVVGQWMQYVTPSLLVLITTTVFTLGCVLFAAWSYYRYSSLLDQLGLGMRGEREVGQHLEELREHHYQVVHDILCDNFNIDHVLIGPSGLYAIETKTRSKLPNQIVDYDGKRILVGGREHDREPLAQAQANARTLRSILKERTGRDYNVRPVVLFPGWWVKSIVRAPEVWVLNPKQLKPRLRHEPQDRLTPEDIEIITAGLARHQKDQEEKLDKES